MSDQEIEGVVMNLYRLRAKRTVVFLCAKTKDEAMVRGRGIFGMHRGNYVKFKIDKCVLDDKFLLSVDMAFVTNAMLPLSLSHCPHCGEQIF